MGLLGLLPVIIAAPGVLFAVRLCGAGSRAACVVQQLMLLAFPAFWVCCVVQATIHLWPVGVAAAAVAYGVLFRVESATTAFAKSAREAEEAEDARYFAQVARRADLRARSRSKSRVSEAALALASSRPASQQEGARVVSLSIGYEGGRRSPESFRTYRQQAQATHKALLVALRNDSETAFDAEWAVYMAEPANSELARYLDAYMAVYAALILANSTGVGHLLDADEQHRFTQTVIADRRFLSRRLNAGSLVASVARLSAPSKGLASYGTRPEMLFATLAVTVIATEQYAPDRVFTASVSFARVADAEAQKRT